MAGDWIPMRIDLADDPAVIAIAAATAIDEYAVVGKLHRLWSWANRQLKDGYANGITVDWIDRYVGTTGFAAAMLAAGWLRTRSGGVELPHFDRWNSEGAKRRVEKTVQKRIQRANAAGDNVARVKDTIPRPHRTAVFARDGHKCVNCGWKPSEGRSPVGLPSQQVLSIDHIYPESRGGQTVISNLVTLCFRCNQQKSNRTFEEAGMSPDLSHIVGDNTATDRGPEKRREEKRREKDKTPAKFDPTAAKLPHQSPAFASAWADWVRHRIEKRESLTPTTTARQLKALGSLTETNAVECIERSIASGWTGLFPDNHRGQASKPNGKPAGETPLERMQRLQAEMDANRGGSP